MDRTMARDNGPQYCSFSVKLQMSVSLTEAVVVTALASSPV